MILARQTPHVEPVSRVPRATHLTMPGRGLLVVTIVVGYEWFVSGLVKFVRGDFPSGLADVLTKKLPDTMPWYSAFLKGTVIPNAPFWGYFIETAELLTGIVLIVAPLIWLFAWERVPVRVRYAVLASTAAAALGGAFLAINLHIANGSTHPWHIPHDGFDEGVDLDSILPAIQIMIAIVCIALFAHLRRSAASEPPTSDHTTLEKS